MKLRNTVLLGLTGAIILCAVQTIYFILNTLTVYSDNGIELYNSIPQILYTCLNGCVVIAWILIMLFFVGLLKKTK